MSNIPMPQQPAHDSDEIDLFELFQSLWQEKILIIVITGLVTVIALAYALMATPIYQTQATLVPPPAYAVQGYNEGRLEAFRNTGVKELSAGDVYSFFKTNLQSAQLRNTFFDEIYLPSLSAEQQRNSRESLLKTFNKVLSVKQGDAKTNPNLYIVSAELDKPIDAAELVKQYIARAVAVTKLEIKNNIQAEQQLHVDALSVKAKSLLDTTKRKREDQIKLLQEALFVAESIGLEDPSAQSDKASLGGNRYIDNDLIYTRGAKTLRAQLDVLQKRTSDEPFIAGFRELNTQLELLKAYTLDDSNVSVVQIDEAAEVPSAPIKPNKKLIVAIGIVLGGMLGVFAALIRSMIRKRKSASAQ